MPETTDTAQAGHLPAHPRDTGWMENVGADAPEATFSIQSEVDGVERTAADGADATPDAPFIAPVAMEDDPDELFPGDRGTLDAEVRRVLVHVLQR